MGIPAGFIYKTRNDQSVAIWHRTKLAVILRGSKAAKFLAEAKTSEPAALQLTMARLTGNYKRGNERGVTEHPRNQPDS